MTGSFLFVKPSNPDGESRPIDPDESPQYPYDRASWEWLLERALRRTLLPWALTKSHSRVLLYGHEDKYSMHRWGSYGESYDANGIPLACGDAFQGAHGTNTDANLSRDDRETPLPESWDRSTGVPVYSYGTKVAYGIADLEEAVATLPFSLEWLHPEWSASALDAWDLSASTTETTQGSAPASPNGRHWTWKTTVDHVPFAIPGEHPFKCLSHMRTDDPIVTVGITNDDNKAIKVETAPTPVSAPRTTDGSIREYHGTQVRSSRDGAVYTATGWALSEFYVRHIHGLDYGPSTGLVAYDRDGKTAETYGANDSTLGCLVDIPGMNSYIAVSYVDKEARFIHDFDWGDGKQTWWHANDFPKGLDSVLSPKLREQLKALCPVCQPAIPPAVPAFLEKFPDADLEWNHRHPGSLPLLYLSGMYPKAWMRHLALACTPFDMSARLDAMTTTVHRVPMLFAKIKTVTTEYENSRNDYIETNSNASVPTKTWEASTYRVVTTVEGTSSNPIPAGDGLTSISGDGSGVTHIHGTDSGPSWTISTSDKTQYKWGESFESNSDFLVCLRSTDNTTLSTKTTTRTAKAKESSYYDPYSSVEVTYDGELPDSYDPDPDDLLFPDWVLPWIETAELFASIESRLGRQTGADHTETDYHYNPDEGADTYLYSGNGSGTRTHKVHRKIVSLGNMDTKTGKFPALDAAELLSEVDPDPTEPSGSRYHNSYDSTTTETTDSDNNKEEETVVVVKETNRNDRSRSVSYYVVVKWKFDRTDPETLETESPLDDLYRKLADAEKALSDKERERSDAKKALSAAQSDLLSAENALAHAQDQLENPEVVYAVLLAEAQAALDRANQKLSDAQSEKSEAQEEYDAAAEAAAGEEERLKDALANLKSAQASLESAQSELSEAQGAVDEAQGAVDEAQAGLESAQSDLSEAQSAVDEAQGAVDEAQAGLESAQSELSEAQGAVDEAQGAVDEAQASLESAQSDLSEAQSAVDEAQGAVDEAQGAVESAYAAYYEAVEAYGEASGRLADAEADETVAQRAADAAQDAYDTQRYRIGEILQKAVDDAQAAVDEATSRVEKWTQKVLETKGEITGLDAKVEAAKQAIRDAGGNVS